MFCILKMQIKLLDDNNRVMKTTVIDMERQKFLNSLRNLPRGLDYARMQIGSGSNVYRVWFDKDKLNHEQHGGFLPALLALLPTLGTALATGAATGVGSAAAGGIIGAIKRAIQRGKERRAERRAAKEAEAQAQAQAQVVQDGSGMDVDMTPAYQVVLRHKGMRPGRELWEVVEQVHQSDLPDYAKFAITKLVREYLSNLNEGNVPAVLYEHEMMGSGMAEIASDLLKTASTDLFKSSAVQSAGTFLGNMAKELAKSTASGILKDMIYGTFKKLLGKKKTVSKSDVVDASKQVKSISREEWLTMLKESGKNVRYPKVPKDKSAINKINAVRPLPEYTEYEDDDDNDMDDDYDDEPPAYSPSPKPSSSKDSKMMDNDVPFWQRGRGPKTQTAYQRFTAGIFSLNKGLLPPKKIMQLSGELWKELKAKGTVEFRGTIMTMEEFQQ